MKKPIFESEFGIYIIICCTNLRFYIGSSAYLYHRFDSHHSELQTNTHGNSHLQNAWNKYGKDAFIFGVLEYCDKSILIQREQFYIDKYHAANNRVGFNINPNAHSCLGRKSSPETIARIIAAHQRNKEKRTRKEIEAHGRDFEIVSPQGELIKYRGVANFAEKYGLHESSVWRVLEGRQDTVRGWHLPSLTPVVYPDKRLRDPDGNIHIIPHGKLKLFATKRGLNQGNLNQVSLGNIISCKGWTKAEV